jgi:hypothetical protein
MDHNLHRGLILDSLYTLCDHSIRNVIMEPMLQHFFPSLFFNSILLFSLLHLSTPNLKFCKAF